MERQKSDWKPTGGTVEGRTVLSEGTACAEALWQESRTLSRKLSFTVA